MNSTNDGKDVKSYQTSGHKGKTYYIELYKSLEARLSGECSGAERTRLVCEAWRRVYSLCQHSAPPTHQHLLSWLQRHTSHTILQTEWQSPKSKEQHTLLDDAIKAFLTECQEAISKRNGVSFSWENQLCNRASWFRSVLPNPWGHPVLKSLLDLRGPQPNDNEVVEWLKEERGVVFVARLRQLAAAKCDDLALLLVAAVMDRARRAAPPVSDAQQAEEPKDKPEVTCLEASFPNILRKEAGFTLELWELIVDIEFVLLYKGESRTRCIELAKQTPLRNGYQLVERLHNRLENSPQEKKLWKNAKDVATLIAQVVIARCVVVPVCAGAARAALYGCAHALAQLLPAARLAGAAAALAAPAATARHLHTLAAAVHAQCKETRKPFVCSLYVRAITAGMNELENLKLDNEKESEARSMEQTLASWFIQLGMLLSASSRLSCECILTAFSVHPSPAMYDRVQRAPPLAPILKPDIQEQEPTTSSEFGSWATDSRTQTNLVKTSETLNLKQTQKQANVLSTAIFTEGEALGLEADLCQDLAVLLSGPRVKTLYWDLDREVLLENCRTYLEKTHGGTRAVTTELKYLNLDPTSFEHLPEEQEDENDIYYGIEKGYEHLVEFEEPLVDYEDILSDNSISTDTGTSLLELPIAIPKRKKNMSKQSQLSSEEEIDPLSFTPSDILNKDKKEKTHNKERSKDKSKDRDKNKCKIKVDGETENDLKNGSIEDRNKDIQRKEKKKERKERKNKDKLEMTNKIKMEHLQSCSSLSRLVGVKITGVSNTCDKLESKYNSSSNVDKNICTDSDYDSQGKSSVTSVNSDFNGNSSFNGVSTLDFAKSPLTDNKQETDIPSIVYTHQNVSSVKEEVKKGIQKLIEYRRHKASNKNLKSADTSINQSHSFKHLPNILHPSVVTPNSVIVPEISKTSSCTQERIFPENESNICMSNNETSHLRDESKSKANVKDSQALLEDNSVKTDPDKAQNPNQFSKHSSSYMKQGRKMSTCLQKKQGNIQDKNNSKEFVYKHRNVQSLKQDEPYLRNLCISPSQTISQELSGKMSNLTPSQKQFHTFLKELQETINAGAIIEKSIPDKTPCFKKTMQLKKTDNAPNTFARLSYMHKNKQFDHKPKLTINPTSTQNQSMQNMTFGQIQHLKGIDQKVSRLQSKGEIVISRVEKTKNSSLNEKSKVLVQKMENTNDTLTSINNAVPVNYNKKYPVISNMLSSDKRTSDFTIPSKIELNVNKQCNIPAPKHSSTTFLSEKDQFDLLLLLRQQSKMKPPIAPVKLQLQKKNVSVIDNNTFQYLKPEKPSISRQNTPSKLFEGFHSPSYPPSVIKATNKSINITTEPKKNRYCKGASKKSISKQKIKNNDAQHSDWKSVMDDLLAQKTPSRGPNALDVLLKKDSFEKRSSDSSGIQNQGTMSIANCQNSNKTSSNNNIPIQPADELNIGLPNSSILLIPKSSDFKLKEEKPNKNNCIDIIKKIPGIIHEKNFPSVIQNSNDPFISGIPNSDYDLLEELMDDDLRQEIGELSSDEETYRSVILSNSKTKSNLSTKESEFPLNKVNVIAAGNSHNNIDSNFSTNNQNCSIKNVPKNTIQKTTANDNNLKPHLFFKGSITKPICVKNSVIQGKTCTKDPDSTQQQITSHDANMTTKTTCNSKNNPINITPKLKIQNLNKISANVCSQNNLPKIVENTKIRASNNNVHETRKGPIILDSAKVLLAVPQRKTTSNVVLIGNDLIYDPFSTLQTNSSKISENLSDLNNSAIAQAPMNLTLLHATPFHVPASTPVSFESSSVPDIQKLPTTNFQQDKPKLKFEETQQMTLNGELQKLSQSVITNPCFNLSTSTNIVSNNNVSDPLLSNCVSGINKHSLQTHTKSIIIPRLPESLKNVDLHRNTKRKVPAKFEFQDVQRLSVNNESNRNDLYNKTTSFASNDSDSKDNEQMQNKYLLLLNRNVRNSCYEKFTALPCDETIQSEKNHKKQENIIEKVPKIDCKYEVITGQNIPIKSVVNHSIQLNDRERDIKLIKVNNSNKDNKQIMEYNNQVKKNINVPVVRLRSRNNVNSAEYETNVNKISKDVKQNSEIINTKINEVQSSHDAEIITSRNLKAVNNEILKGKNEPIYNMDKDKVYTKQDYELPEKKIEKGSYSQNNVLEQEKVYNVNFEENLIGARKEIQQDKIKFTSQQSSNRPDVNSDKIALQTDVHTLKIKINKDKKTSKTKMNDEIDKHVDNTEIPPHNTDTATQLTSILPKSKKLDETPHISHCMITTKECDVNNKLRVEHFSDGKHSEIVTESIRSTNQCIGLDTGVNTDIAEDQTITTKNVTDHQLEKTIVSGDISKDICSEEVSLNKNNDYKSNNINFLGHKIVYDELPNLHNGPFKRCVRIKLANGKSFKVTISGKLNVKIDSIFEDPTVKSLLLKNINNNRKCTLNIQQLFIQNKKEPPILRTEVKNISYQNPIIDSETINLISDDEDSDSQSFRTEFGNFIVSPMDQNVLEKHQKKLSLKSMVLLERCKVLQSFMQSASKSNEPEINNMHKENQPSTPKQSITDYIEIDDSSDDCPDEVNPYDRNINECSNKKKSLEKVNNLKNLLVQDLGVEDNIGNNKTEDRNSKEINKNQELVPLIRNNESKLKTCLLKLEKCDDLVEKLRIKKQKCFVSLVRCDQAMKDSDKKILHTENKMLNPDKTAKTTLKRSKWILNKLSLDNPKDLLQSTKEIQPRLSPSLLNNFAKLPTDVNMIHLSDIKCDADWFTTKTFLHKSFNIHCRMLAFPTSNFVNEDIKYDEYSTDCESDLDASLSISNDSYTQNLLEVPSLVKLVVNLLACRSDLMDRIINIRLPLKNVTQCSALKRKATGGIYLRQNKICKTKDYFKSETMCCTKVISQELHDKNSAKSIDEITSLSSGSVIMKPEEKVIDCAMKEAKDHELNAYCKRCDVIYGKSDPMITSGQKPIVSELKAQLNLDKIFGPRNSEYLSTHICGELNIPSNTSENIAEITEIKENPTATKCFESEKTALEFSNLREIGADAICNLDKSNDSILGELKTVNVSIKNRLVEPDVIICKTNFVVPENTFSIHTEMKEECIEILNKKFNNRKVNDVKMLDKTYIMEDMKLNCTNKQECVNNEKEKKAHIFEKSTKLFLSPDTEKPLHSKFELSRGPQNDRVSSSLQNTENNDTFSLVDEQNINSCAIFKENVSIEENYSKIDMQKSQSSEYTLTMHTEKNDECIEESNKEQMKLAVASPSVTVNVPIDIITENKNNIIQRNNLSHEHDFVHEIEIKEKGTYTMTNISCSKTSDNLRLLDSKCDTQAKSTFKICEKFKCSLKDLNLIEFDERLVETETCQVIKRPFSMQKTLLNPFKDIDINTSKNTIILKTRCDSEDCINDHDKKSEYKSSNYADTETGKGKSITTMNKKCSESAWPIEKSKDVEIDTKVNSQLITNDENTKLQISHNLQTDVFSLKLPYEKSYSLHSLTPVARDETRYSSLFNSGILLQEEQEFENKDKPKTVNGEITSPEYQQQFNPEVDTSEQNETNYYPLKESTDNITCHIHARVLLNIPDKRFNTNANIEEISTMTVERKNTETLESTELEERHFSSEENKNFEYQHNVNTSFTESEGLKEKSTIIENKTCNLSPNNVLETKYDLPPTLVDNSVIDSAMTDKNNDIEFILETKNANNLNPVDIKTLLKLDATDNHVDVKVKHRTDIIDSTNLEQTKDIEFILETKNSNILNPVDIKTLLTLDATDNHVDVKVNHRTDIIDSTNLEQTKDKFSICSNLVYIKKKDVVLDLFKEKQKNFLKEDGNTLKPHAVFTENTEIKHQDICIDNVNELTSKCDFSEAKSKSTDNLDGHINYNENRIPEYVNNDTIEGCLSNTGKITVYYNTENSSSNSREIKNSIGLRNTRVRDLASCDSTVKRKCDMASVKSESCTNDKISSNVTSTTQVLTKKANTLDHDSNNLVIKESTPLIQDAINFRPDDYTTKNINIKSNNNDARKNNELHNKTISRDKNTYFFSYISSNVLNVTGQVNCDVGFNNTERKSFNTKKYKEKEIVPKTDVSTSYDNKLQKNVTLVYNGDSNVILKGSIYEDPVVGTCYVFPSNKASMIHKTNCINICENKTFNVIENLKSQFKEDYQYIGNFKVPPKLTYARERLKNDDIVKGNGKKCRNNLKRKLEMKTYDNKLSAKRYRNGKNIDYPRFTVTTMLESAYSKEYKQLLDYCSSIKFSFSRTFHKEYIDVPAVLKYWPIKEIDVKIVTDKSDFENLLFSEHEKEISFDPLQQTLVEEISSKHERFYTSEHISETNFNMGFGDGSDRVITSDGNNNVSIVSAATLSDVKQSQPFLSSEDNVDCAYKHRLWMPNKGQIEILKRSISYIQLRDKVRSFFKKSAAELHYNWDMDNMNHKNTFQKQHVKSKFPYALLNSEFIEPAPIEMVVQVVQVGQLSVSNAMQNPVTCDPRVTQVTDASPQSSMVNSPHDDSQSPIKTEYTELTTADLSLPLVQEYERHIESQEYSKISNSHHEDIPVETEMTSIVKTEITVELSPLKEEPIDYENESDDLQSLVNKHINNVEYTYDSNDNTILETQSSSKITYDSPEREENEYPDQHEEQNGIAEKTDQIAHAMNAAGITTNQETLINPRPHDLVNVLSPKICHEGPTTTSLSPNNYSRSPINAMTLQQALAQILPPPLNQANHENNQTTANSSVTSQVLHIVHGKNTNGNQITLVDNTQNSVISNTTTPVLHIVQNKGSNTGSPSNLNSGQHANSYTGLSLVDTGIQQGSNPFLHIVNANNQKNNGTGQILKRVNLLTNLTNVQGSNEQKMVQFVCKSADGKSIHLNAPHQRGMVLRLQPIETPTIQTSPKDTECQDGTNSTSNTNIIPNKEPSALQHEIKSRSVYEENYAKFIQSSSNKSLEKSTSLPKFNQAFGKQIFQDNIQKGDDPNTSDSNLTCVNSNSENSECQPNENSINLDHIGQINSPPLLLRKNTTHSAQTQPAANLVQQIKQTIAPMNIQTMHGGVIYTRQIPVNIGGGQTINLITVPTTELIDDANQKQKGDIKFINQNELDSPIIKIVPQSHTTPNTECTTDESTNHTGLNSENAQNAQTQHQPVLTQMRIKLPMLSKTHQMVSGARVVRPSFFQIQRNVIGGANQHVYQQLVLTAAPPLGQHTIRLPQNQACRQIKIATEGQSSSEPQMSSSTLEQLREFDMVLEQVKERSTVQPNANSNPNNTFTKLPPTPSCDTIDSTSVTSTVTESTQQVLYSIGSNQSLNIAYVNRKSVAATPTTSTFVRSPDSPSITEAPSSTHVPVPHTVTNGSSVNESAVQPNQQKPAKVGSKSKSRPKSSNPPNSLKINTVPPKSSTQKPLEDEQTTQRILFILAEYKEQVENSPDKDKPAPRRRSNPPTNPSGSSKRKKSSSGSRRPGARDMSPVHGEDTCRTMGSEDSSCGTSLGDCNENCLENHSPQNSPTKVNRKLSFDGVAAAAAAVQSRPQPQRNVIVADGQTITVARGTTGKPATAVLMPANYILPVSMVKGGQQIAIVTNRGPKLLTVGGGEGGATNALLLQRLIGPAGLKPVLTRPGVRHVRLPTGALHNLHAFNLSTVTNAQPPDSTVSPASAPTPPDLIETRPDSSPWAERECQDVKPERESSPDDSEPWNLPTSADPHDYTYEDRVRTENMNRTVLVVHKKDGSSQRHHRLTHVSAAALRHKYAILEHELRLQKSLSEECEDLGVDSPSASELFPEAELLFSSSPAHECTQNSHTPQPTIINQSCMPHPDMDDQIATDELIQREAHDHQELDVRTLGLDEGIVTVSEDGLQATIALDQEEFARSHPNTTFHSEPTEEGEVEPFTIAGLKGRHITSTIFHAGRAPATVLVTAPQTSVISQATTDIMHNNLKYANMDQIINSSHGNHENLNLSSVLVKDDRPTKFDNILTDTRELHLSNTASAIVHATGNATQVIRRVCYDDDKRDNRFLMDEPEGLIAGDDAKMIAEDSSRDNTFESITGDVDDDNSYPERHTELFWESNSASERSEGRRQLDFSSDSDKCCKSPSYDETNSTDSSGVGTQMRLDSVIKDARGIDRGGSADGSSDDMHPPLRTYPAKRVYHPLEGDMERSISGKTRAGERSPDISEVRRRASGRGVVKRGCHCCTGSPAPPRPKKSRQKKPNMDFNN